MVSTKAEGHIPQPPDAPCPPPRADLLAIGVAVCRPHGEAGPCAARAPESAGVTPVSAAMR